MDSTLSWPLPIVCDLSMSSSSSGSASTIELPENPPAAKKLPESKEKYEDKYRLMCLFIDVEVDLEMPPAWRDLFDPDCFERQENKDAAVERLRQHEEAMKEIKEKEKRAAAELNDPNNKRKKEEQDAYYAMVTAAERVRARNEERQYVSKSTMQLYKSDPSRKGQQEGLKRIKEKRQKSGRSIKGQQRNGSPGPQTGDTEKTEG